MIPQPTIPLKSFFDFFGKPYQDVPSDESPIKSAKHVISLDSSEQNMLPEYQNMLPVRYTYLEHSANEDENPKAYRHEEAQTPQTKNPMPANLLKFLLTTIRDILD